jgi:alkylhydroperoxidase/carboxymuconolactone decarboxylase family protein YurZ
LLSTCDDTFIVVTVVSVVLVVLVTIAASSSPAATMATTSGQQALKDRLIELGEVWSAAWEAVLEACPDYLAAYLKMRSVPLKNRHLSRKLQELLLLACDASCTHLFEPGIRLHTENALKAGATKGEVLEVLMRTSVLGIHAVSVGLPILFEVLVEEGKMTEEELVAPNDDYRESLKAEFTKKRGFWAPHYQKLITIGKY